MGTKEIIPDLHAIKLGPVYAYLLDEGDDGLTLIDSGFS